MEQQQAATSGIAQNVNEVAQGAERVNVSLGSVSAAASQAGDSAHHVLQAANDLHGRADAVRRQVEDFLSGAKAA